MCHVRVQKGRNGSPPACLLFSGSSCHTMNDDLSVARSPVVLDLGSAYIKCGFAGESAPRRIIPSPLDAWLRSSRAEGWSKQQWVDVLGPLLVNVFTSYLKCRSKDRKVLLTEAFIPCRIFRNALHDVLYDCLRVSGILTAPSLSTALYCTGADGGVIIDVGYRESHVLIVAHGRLLIETYQVVGVGSGHVVRRFRDMVGAEECTERQDEDLVVRTSFVMSLVPDQRPVRAVKDKKSGINVGVEVRSTVGEVYFAGVEEDQDSLPIAVLEALRKCPKDIRKQVAGHIIVTGGGAMLPGFCRRLTEELRQSAEIRPRYQVLRPVVDANTLCVVRDIGCPRNIATWVGGSILAVLEETTGASLFVPRSEYEEEN